MTRIGYTHVIKTLTFKRCKLITKYYTNYLILKCNIFQKIRISTRYYKNFNIRYWLTILRIIKEFWSPSVFDYGFVEMNSYFRCYSEMIQEMLILRRGNQEIYFPPLRLHLHQLVNVIYK